MIDCIYFRAWVANSVYAVSGIWPLDWQGSQRKCALTFAEVRAAACQEVFADYLQSQILGTARHSAIVDTDLSDQRRILH